MVYLTQKEQTFLLNHYHKLGLRRDATKEQVLEAMIRITELHKEENNGAIDWNTFDIYLQAFSTLYHENRRKEYDGFILRKASLNTTYQRLDAIPIYNIVSALCAAKLNSMDSNYYQVLALPRDASDEEIIAAYRYYSEHIDLSEYPSEWKHDLTDQLSLVAETLLHPDRRNLYDSFLKMTDDLHVQPEEKPKPASRKFYRSNLPVPRKFRKK